MTRQAIFNILNSFKSCLMMMRVLEFLTSHLLPIANDIYEIFLAKITAKQNYDRHRKCFFLFCTHFTNSDFSISFLFCRQKIVRLNGQSNMRYSLMNMKQTQNRSIPWSQFTKQPCSHIAPQSNGMQNWRS